MEAWLESGHTPYKVHSWFHGAAKGNEMFCYSEGKQEAPKFFVKYDRMNATKGYLTHYENFHYLRFIRDNPLSTPAEKRQAIREIAICDRKLNWWWKHPNLDKQLVEEGKRQIQRNWAVKR